MWCSPRFYPGPIVIFNICKSNAYDSHILSFADDTTIYLSNSDVTKFIEDATKMLMNYFSGFAQTRYHLMKVRLNMLL